VRSATPGARGAKTQGSSTHPAASDAAKTSRGAAQPNTP
jgi:hypothetical protein